VQNIGRKSITRYEQGWSWKHDHEMARDLRDRVPNLDDVLPGLTCAMALLRAEHGYVSIEDGETLRELTDARLRVIELQGSGHHPMLDRPGALIDVFSDVLRAWPPAA
jgi:pimeloyl-ACP methyl ester carboxylesterase